MTCDWLMRHGHSMGASDIVVSSKTQAEIERLSNEAREGVLGLLGQVHAGKFVNESSGSDVDALERAVVNELDKARDAIGKIVTAEGKAAGSRLLFMVNAKSKGNPKNVVQMAGILGQNLIDDGRMPPTLGDRTLPHFHRHDISADARGFIATSFREGLRPHEFFFHANGGPRRLDRHSRQDRRLRLSAAPLRQSPRRSSGGGRRVRPRCRAQHRLVSVRRRRHGRLRHSESESALFWR